MVPDVDATDGSLIAEEKECDYKTVCAYETDDTSLVSYRIDKEGERSKFYLRNWVEQMNL